jgi:hypothetical protein
MTLRLILTGAPWGKRNALPRYDREQRWRYRASARALPKHNELVNQLPNRAILWLAPWDTRDYPGRQRLIAAFLGRSVTRQGIWCWRAGKALLPAWAARAWVSAIRTRCEIGLAIAAELEAHAEQMERDPAHGRNLRAMRASGVAPGGLGARGRLALRDAAP